MWYSVGSTIYMAGMWVISFLVVKISGYDANGVFTVVMSTTAMFYTIAAWGMRPYQVSDLQGKFSDNTYIISRFLTCAVSLLACAVYVFANQDLSFIDRVITLVYMVFKLSEAFVDVYNGIVQKHWRMDIIGKSYIARAVLTVVSFGVVLKLSDSLLLAVSAMIICSFAVIVAYDIVQTVKIAKVKIKLDFHGIDKLLIACAPLIVCAFLYTFNLNYPRLIMKSVYEDADPMLGYYGAIAAPVLIIQLLASFIYAPLIPLFSKSHTENNPKAFAGLLSKAILIILALSAAAAIGCYFLGDWGLALLYGPKSLPVENSYLLIPTLFTAVCTAFIWLLNNAITAVRQIKFLFFSAIVGSIVCVAISKICINVYGVNGINVSMIIVQLVQIILLLGYLVWYIIKGLSAGKGKEIT